MALWTLRVSDSDVDVNFLCITLLLGNSDDVSGKRTEKGHLRQWQKGLQSSTSSDCCSLPLLSSVLSLSSQESVSGQMSKAIASISTDRKIARNFTTQI